MERHWLYSLQLSHRRADHLISGGKSAIEEFQSRSNQDFKPILANFPIPDLLIREDLEILADYFEH